MNVLLVTSWGDQICGIAEHSKMLIEAVHACAPDIQITPSAEALDPSALLRDWAGRGPAHDVVWLNYQAALHSRWTPERIAQARQQGAIPIGCTYHDSGVPNSEHCQAIVGACDAAVVHEPFDDLPAEKTHYWRQGVPVNGGRMGYRFRIHQQGPVIGTAGFDFPWKNYELLCDLAGELGWGVVICVPQEPALDRRSDLERRCRGRLEMPVGLDRDMVVATLAECDATAFLYVTHNTGTSGAIRLGIAAKKPLLAFSTCRQFRDLLADPLGERAIFWVESVEHLKANMPFLTLSRFDASIAALAEQDSWTRLGQKYADLYRSLVA